MLDEETGAEPRVLSGSISDQYLMLLREDHSVLVAQMDGSNYELEELEKTDKAFTANKWTAGCLYTDTKGTFQHEKEAGEKAAAAVLLFLLSSTGALHVFQPHYHSLASLGRYLQFAGLRRLGSLKASLRCRGPDAFPAIPVSRVQTAERPRQGYLQGDPRGRSW